MVLGCWIVQLAACSLQLQLPACSCSFQLPACNLHLASCILHMHFTVDLKLIQKIWIQDHGSYFRVECFLCLYSFLNACCFFCLGFCFGRCSRLFFFCHCSSTVRSDNANASSFEYGMWLLCILDTGVRVSYFCFVFVFE